MLDIVAQHPESYLWATAPLVGSADSGLPHIAILRSAVTPDAL